MSWSEPTEVAESCRPTIRRGEFRRGVSVAAFGPEQRDFLEDVIAQWAGDYHAAFSESFIGAYLSEEALADTVVAWAGSEDDGPRLEIPGTYFRIDGPRLWIELSCQPALIGAGTTHYHGILRDKTMDYGGQL